MTEYGPQQEPRWPAEKLMSIAESGVIGLTKALARITSGVSVSDPSDEFLDATDKFPPSTDQVDSKSAQLLARLADYYSSRFHTPY